MSGTPLLSSQGSPVNSGSRKAPVLAKRELVNAARDVKSSMGLDKHCNISTGAHYFRENFNLAASVGFFIMIFCIPVCSQTVDDLLFVKLDLAGMLGATTAEMKAQWPLVFTLLFFQVKIFTGNTIQNCWSGLMGIACATTNILILSHFFPEGGKCKTLSKEPIAMGLRHSCDEYSDSNYGSVWGWVVWVDLFLFLFLELASQVPEPTKKWGMCQTIAYMMGFMNHAGFHFSYAQVVLSLVGLFLGICVTLVPNMTSLLRGKGLNFGHVATLKLRPYPEDLAHRMRALLINSINFLDRSAELDRHTRTSMRFALESEVDEITPVIQAMREVYGASTWERVLFALTCHRRRWKCDRKHTLRFLKAFEDSIGGFDDLLYMVKKVVLSDDHTNYSNLNDGEKRSVDRERDLVKRQLYDLSSKTSDHLCKIARPPVLGRPDDYNEDVAIKDIADKATALRRAYNLIPDLKDDASRPLQRLRNQLGCYVFATLCYSRQVADTFGQESRDIKEDPVNFGKDLKTYFLTSFGDITENGYKFLNQLRTNEDQRCFVIRNMVSVFSCFVMGNFLQGNVFTGFSPTCAVTLALLISHFPGSAFDTNLQRLLGLTLGKVVPIIIMAIVSLAGKKGPFELLVHLLFIWVYESFFAFISYTSPQWGGMAGIVAGFGCGSLIGTRSTTWTDALFKAQYMEIGQTTACIMLQMVVDVIDTSLRKRWPRDVVITNMTKLGMPVNAKEAMNGLQTEQHLASKERDGAILRAFENFMALTEDSMEKMLKCIEEAKDLTSKQEGLVNECAPRQVVVRGKRTPFKHDAGVKAIKWIKRLVQEMELLYMVYKRGPKSAGTPEPQFVHNLHLDQTYQDAILQTMRLTFMDVQMVFSHDNDGFIERPYKANPKMEDPDMNWRISGDSPAATKPGDFRRDLCVCVAQRALYDALSHVTELQHICYSTGSFAYERRASEGFV